MIENFRSGSRGKIAKDIWENGRSSKIPKKFHLRAKALLQIMYATDSLNDLKSKGHPPSVRLHHLKFDRKGEMAIDIDKTSGWRMTFVFKNSKFFDVGIEDYLS